MTQLSVLSYSPPLPATYIEQIPNIQNLLLHLEGKGRSKNTLTAIAKALKALAIRADLTKPQAVELAIARYQKQNGQPASNAYKSKLCDSYQHYCKLHKIEWEKAIYTPEETGIQPPSNEKIQMLIASAKGTLSLKIQISAETGLRPIEIHGNKGLQARNIHPDQKTITALNTKRCNARPAMPITQELTARLQTYIAVNNIQPNELLFKGDERRYGEHYRRFRNKLANKLNDPTIKAIRLYDLRHAYATRQLRKTQNAETVRIMMGHKKLDTTQKYLHLLGNENGEWLVESTTDQKRADELLKQDFTYILTTPDGYMKFRKPK